MRRYTDNKKRYKLSRSVSLIILLAVIFTIFSFIINRSLGPMLMPMAEQYGRSEVSRRVNDAVMKTFDDEAINYSDIVSLNYNSMGLVTSCGYDGAKINHIKIALSENLDESLKKLKATKIKIPIGSVTADIGLSGRGFNFTAKIVQSSVPEVQLISLFESVGINIVKHEIIVRVTVNSKVYLPPKSGSFCFTQDFVIAQTIIVGNVPSGYADIG